MSLFSTQLQNQLPFAPMQNNVKFSRSGEPVSVNGMESVLSFATFPNTVSILFHETEPIFYRVATDANNHPAIRYFHYDEISPPDATQYVTLADFNKFKEDFINEWKHIWDKSGAVAAPLGTSERSTNAASAPDAEHSESQPKPAANVAGISKPESSIW